jgi:hypothetical protein
VIHAGELRAQQVVDAPIAEAPPRLGDVDDLAALSASGLLDPATGGIGGSCLGRAPQAAGVALGKIELLDHLADGLALGLWG